MLLKAFWYTVAMHLDIPHKLPTYEAKARIVETLSEARAKAAGKLTITEERWENNILHFDITAEGQRITGTLEIQEKAFALEAKLPFMLRLFEGQIEKAAKEQVANMLTTRA